MATATITKRHRAQVAREDARKLRLEKIFAREAKSIFSRMLKDFRASVMALGAEPSGVYRELYQSDWRGALSRHYERVQRSFRGVVGEEQEALSGRKTRQELPQDLEPDPEAQAKEAADEDEDALIVLLLGWRAEQALTAAQWITLTNDKNMRDALMQARQQLVEEGQPTDNRSVAAAASVLLARKFAVRVPIIAESETQHAAESTKAAEAEIAAKRMERPPPPEPGKVVVPPPRPQKMWVTMGDRRVRPHHKKAEGQIVSIDGIFFVGGEMLRFPRDIKYGATPRNTVRCRCAAIYVGLTTEAIPGW